MGILGAILSLAMFMASIAMFVVAGVVYHDWGTPRILLVTFGVVAFGLGIIFAVYSKRMDTSKKTTIVEKTEKTPNKTKMEMKKSSS